MNDLNNKYVKEAIKETDKEIQEDIKKMAAAKKKLIKIKIANYADLEDMLGKLAKAGLWVKMEEVEAWPSGTERFLCIEVDNDICSIV